MDSTLIRISRTPNISAFLVYVSLKTICRSDIYYIVVYIIYIIYNYIYCIYYSKTIKDNNTNLPEIYMQTQYKRDKPRKNRLFQKLKFIVKFSS